MICNYRALRLTISIVDCLKESLKSSSSLHIHYPSDNQSVVMQFELAPIHHAVQTPRKIQQIGRYEPCGNFATIHSDPPILIVTFERQQFAGD